LADLGAEVIRVEPPAGAPSRQAPPLLDDQSLYFATHNANKRSVALDLGSERDRQRFLQLLGSADLLIESHKPGTLEALGLPVALLRQHHPALIVLSITDFGQTGPYRDYVASNA